MSRFYTLFMHSFRVGLSISKLGMLWSGVLCGMVAGSKKPAGGGGFGGFGAPPKAPPTLREVCNTFKSRIPKDPSVPCACGEKLSYAECCRPYHKGEAAAESPEALLRARYAGFAYRLIPYIIETTDRSNPDYMKDKIAWAKKLNKNMMFDGFSFVSLEIGEREEGTADYEAILSPNVFTVRPAQGDDLVMRERTRFVKRKASAVALHPLRPRRALQYHAAREHASTRAPLLSLHPAPLHPAPCTPAALHPRSTSAGRVAIFGGHGHLGGGGTQGTGAQVSHLVSRYASRTE